MSVAGKSLLKFIAWSLTACTCVPLTAAAHHSSTSFDLGKRYIFHGTVRKFLWENPHAWLYVQVRKADGTSELWGFEANGPNVLSRNGWHASTLKEGDKVTVYGNPERIGRHNALMSKVLLADGQTLMASPDLGNAGEAGGKPGNGLPPPPQVTAVEY
jgi:hypothetical protein